MSSPDIALTADYIRHVDSAIETSADSIDALCHRRFWNAIETNKWDWPNFQRAYPWRIWFDQAELADTTVNVPVVTSGGNVIPANQIFWGPWNYSPPFTFMELNRSTSASFGQGDTPQQDVLITGNFGFWAQTRPGGSLAAAISSTTALSATVADSSVVGVGDVITVDSESMLVRDKISVSTTVSFGSLTDDASDNLVAVPDVTQFGIGEVLTLDAEQVLILSTTGENLVVERAVNSTVLADHTSGTIYAPRGLVVARGFGGTTAATHLSAATVSVSLVPPQVRELAIAESLNTVYQKTTGYARTIGEAGAAPVPGGSLPDLRAQVLARYARKSRQRVV